MADGDAQKGPPGKAVEDTPKSSPYNFYVVVVALGVLAVVFILIMLYFRPVFTDATAITTALSSLFTVVGTVVGAYFGIKLSSDTNDKAQAQIDKTNDKTQVQIDKTRERTNLALAELDPDIARQVVEKTS